VSNPPQSYYTVDDGTTYFTDDASKGFSFDHNGQPAVQAMVYSCDGGSTKFVAYLRRANPAGGARPPAPGVSVQLAQMMRGIQVKRPGVGNWVTIQGRASADILDVKCPGGNGTASPVLP
jgi:hypothetical protein